MLYSRDTDVLSGCKLRDSNKGASCFYQQLAIQLKLLTLGPFGNLVKAGLLSRASQNYGHDLKYFFSLTYDIHLKNVIDMTDSGNTYLIGGTAAYKVPIFLKKTLYLYYNIWVYLPHSTVYMIAVSFLLSYFTKLIER